MYKLLEITKFEAFRSKKAKKIIIEVALLAVIATSILGASSIKTVEANVAAAITTLFLGTVLILIMNKNAKELVMNADEIATLSMSIIVNLSFIVLGIAGVFQWLETSRTTLMLVAMVSYIILGKALKEEIIESTSASTLNMALNKIAIASLSFGILVKPLAELDITFANFKSASGVFEVIGEMFQVYAPTKNFIILLVVAYSLIYVTFISKSLDKKYNGR